jgi:RNA polymerase subunit RPABC4/transcription elongation factor Spt4
MNDLATLLSWTDADTWLEAGRIVGIAAALYIITLWAALVYWTYRDITMRTTDQTTQAVCVITVAVFFVPGLLLYLALRPQEMLTDAYNRKLEAEAFMHEIEKYPACSSCRRAVREDFVMCPYCRESLRTACGECGEYLANAWVACPFCTTERTPAGRPAVAAARRYGELERQSPPLARPARPTPRPVQPLTP